MANYSALVRARGGVGSGRSRSRTTSVSALARAPVPVEDFAASPDVESAAAVLPDCSEASLSAAAVLPGLSEASLSPELNPGNSKRARTGGHSESFADTILAAASVSDAPPRRDISGPLPAAISSSSLALIEPIFNAASAASDDAPAVRYECAICLEGIGVLPVCLMERGYCVFIWGPPLNVIAPKCMHAVHRHCAEAFAANM